MEKKNALWKKGLAGLTSISFVLGLFSCQTALQSSSYTPTSESVSESASITITDSVEFGYDLKQIFLETYKTLLGESYTLSRFDYDPSDLLDPGSMPLKFAASTDNYRIEAEADILRKNKVFSLQFNQVDLRFKNNSPANKLLSFSQVPGAMNIYSKETLLWTNKASDLRFQINFTSELKVLDSLNAVLVPVGIRAENSAFTLKGPAVAELSLGVSEASLSKAYPLPIENQNPSSAVNCLEAEWVKGRMEMMDTELEEKGNQALDPALSINLIGTTWGVEEGFACEVMGVSHFSDVRDYELKNIRYYENGERVSFDGEASLHNLLATYEDASKGAAALLSFSGEAYRDDIEQSSFVVTNMEKPFLREISYELGGDYSPAKENLTESAVLLPGLDAAQYFHVYDEQFFIKPQADGKGHFPFKFSYKTLAYDGPGKGEHQLYGTIEIDYKKGTFILRTEAWESENDLSVPVWSGELRYKVQLAQGIIYPMITHLDGQELATPFRLEPILNQKTG